MEIYSRIAIICQAESAENFDWQGNHWLPGSTLALVELASKMCCFLTVGLSAKSQNIGSKGTAIGKSLIKFLYCAADSTGTFSPEEFLPQADSAREVSCLWLTGG